MLRMAMDMVEDALLAGDPVVAASAFGDRARRLGATFVQVRRYRRPSGALTSERHWRAGGVLIREAREGWIGSSGFQYICFDCNPLLDVVRQRRTRYRFSDLAPRSDRRFNTYWEAFEGAAIREAWGANAYGADHTTASVHVGVDNVTIDPTIARALQMAGGVLAEHLLTLDASYPVATARPLLTVRERDVLRFVAQGKTDWEIGIILSVSETTARFHADNARRKLGAVNRAHAVACFIAEEGAD